MLAAVRWMAVLVGAGAGGLASALLALVAWAILASADVADASVGGLTVGVIGGLVVAGLVAGRLAPVSARFHGSIAGLGVAAAVVVVSLLGGSPAATGEVAWLGFLGIVLGGVGGVFGGRRR